MVYGIHYTTLRLCVLMPRWLTRLEKKMEEYVVAGTHPVCIMYHNNRHNYTPYTAYAH
jgi:hypothetical protein